MEVLATVSKNGIFVIFKKWRFSLGLRKSTISPAGRAGKAWSVLVSNNGNLFSRSQFPEYAARLPLREEDSVRNHEPAEGIAVGSVGGAS